MERYFQIHLTKQVTLKNFVIATLRNFKFYQTNTKITFSCSDGAGVIERHGRRRASGLPHAHGQVGAWAGCRTWVTKKRAVGRPCLAKNMCTWGTDACSKRLLKRWSSGWLLQPVGKVVENMRKVVNTFLPYAHDHRGGVRSWVSSLDQ